MSSFTSPEKNIEELRLPIDATVVDLGCGSGHYVFSMAKALLAQGGKGIVYAVDVQKSLLDKVAKQASQEGLTNVKVVWADLDIVGGVKLPDQSADVAVVSNVLFQAENRQNFLTEAIRLLKSGGQMLVVDWTDSFNGLGPLASMIVSSEEVINLAKSLGLSKVREFPAGAHHFGIIFRKSQI